MWKRSGEYENIVDQGEAWTLEEIHVRFYIGDLIFRESAIAAVKDVRGGPGTSGSEDGEFGATYAIDDGCGP